MAKTDQKQPGGALKKVQALDLSQTTWPGLPPTRVVSAITFAAQRGLNRHPHLAGAELRRELAERLGVDDGRVILGNGVTQLLAAATGALISPGDRLLTRWPSYPLYPILARRASGEPVRVTGGVRELLQAAEDPRARAIVIARPNDPTGELIGAGELCELLDGTPERVAILLDEALIEYAAPQAAGETLEILQSHPRLLVFRSFSKAWGLAGVRIGYAIGGPGSEALLAELEPDLGVSELSQAGALESLRGGGRLLERRVEQVRTERSRLAGALRDRGYSVSESEANFLWTAHTRLQGAELAERLMQAGIAVAAGEPLGEVWNVRITVCSPHERQRLLAALDGVGITQADAMPQR